MHQILRFELCPEKFSLSRMKHSGKALQAGLKLIVWSLLLVVGICALGLIARYFSAFIDTAKWALAGLWVAFAAFTLYFFRDPNPVVPDGKGLILSPGHGTVDRIDETEEPVFIGGRCRRISMFLSPLNVHVQNAPVAGRIACVRVTPGKFMSAMRVDCGLHNENVLIGIESAEVSGARVGVRLIAGVLARRIIPFVKEGDQTARGERISLIQFGSRCDVYLPPGTEIAVKLGDKVKGGETVLARHL
jgi:phosphatidylserine decarboxylase